jgi:hypothetical protein
MMFDHNGISGTKAILLAGVLASSILVSRVGAQPATPAATPEAVAAAPARTPPAAPAHFRYHPNRFSRRAGLNYRSSGGSSRSASNGRSRAKSFDLDIACWTETRLGRSTIKSPSRP